MHDSILSTEEAAERDKMLSEIPKPTPYGQRIIDLLCDHLADSGFPYWVPAMGSTSTIVEWLAARMGKSVRSVAGALADLIEKRLVSTSWEHECDGVIVRYGKDISVTTQGWCHWSRWSEEEMTRLHGDSLEEWLDWDGIDGTVLGYEFRVREAEVFGT
jgi:hypothetical protein